MHKIMKLFFVALVVAISVAYIFSPSENHPESNTTRHISDAIQFGRSCAFLLFLNEKGLEKWSIEPASARISSSNFRQMALSEIHDLLDRNNLSTDKIGYTWWFPIYYEADDLKLLAYESNDSFIVMTYAMMKDSYRILEIPNTGILLYTVAIRYYRPYDDTTYKVFLRKVSNMPVINLLFGHYGTTGRWLLFDYAYTFNRNDYVNWLLKHGEAFISTHRKDSLTSSELSELVDSLLQSADTDLNSSYMWGISTVSDQIKRVDTQYQRGTPKDMETYNHGVQQDAAQAPRR